MFKVISSFLSILLISSLLAPISAQAYSDLSEYDRYSTSVESFVDQGILSDGELFRPKDTVTRGEFLKVLYKTFPRSSKTCLLKGEYADVQSWDWYAVYACYQAKDQLLVDVKTEMFDPYGTVSRKEAVLALTKHLSLDTSGVRSEEVSYLNIPINRTFSHDIEYIREKNLLPALSENHFGVFESITRRDAVEMLYRMQYIQKNNLDIFDLSFEDATPPSAVPSTAITIDLTADQQAIYNNKLQQIWSLVNQIYITPDELDTKQAYEEAISAMVSSVGDKYTVYMPAVDAQDFSESLDMDEFEGIGAYVMISDLGVLIDGVMPDGPAYRSGIKSGDIIMSIDQESIDGLSLDEVVMKIRGPKGSTVLLGILRDNISIEIPVVRDRVEIKDIESKLMEGMGYIRLRSFGLNSAEEFISALQDMDIQRIDNLIIDVRDNPGGYLTTVVDIMGYFLEDNDLIVYTEGSQSGRYDYTVRKNTLHGNGKEIVVLVNENSASASEILAGAFQDYEKATVIGTQTYGKGSAQEFFELTDGSAVKITTDYWYTPNGNSIQDVGITPDILVEMTQEIYDEQGDVQLDRAIEYLKYGK